jgi:integrase
MGFLYKQKSRDGTPGQIWWVKYYRDGRPIRESTGTTSESAARRFLKEREGRVATGQPILPRADRIRYEEVAQDLRRHYETTGARDLDEADFRLAHLRRFFLGRRIAGIGPADGTAYALKRQAEGAENGTINRELAVLNRMLRLAYENGKLLRLPLIRRLKEAGPRQGFFEPEDFEAVRRRLPPDLQVAVTLAYTFGWRMQSEVLALERRQLDLEAGTLRLEPGTTKTDEGRLVYLPPEVKRLLTEQVERVRALERRTGRIIPSLFPHLRGLRRGTRIQDFKRRWQTACEEAGLLGKLRHDFRRTAVRNMVNRGIPERVAMTISGHKTRSVFDRYHIVSPGDLREAAQKLTGITAGITPAQAPDRRPARPRKHSGKRPLAGERPLAR